MSWFGAIKRPSDEDTREARRQELESDRKLRQEQREARQKQLFQLKEAREQADKACQDLLDLDPDIFAGESVEITDEEAARLLLDETNDIKMADFEDENGIDGEKAMDKLGSVKCDFDKDDIEYWFSEFETQLEVIEVKSQWTKRIALQRCLPAEIKQEVKSLMIIKKGQAGNDIYKKIKNELLDLFGPKPEDAYNRAKNRVMTGKPSQLGKALINDICRCPIKLQSECCSQIIWGMYREALPVVIRNHIAEMEFNKNTYKQIFQKSDQVYDSNKSTQPVKGTVAAVSSHAGTEVAAAKPNRFPPKNQKPQGNATTKPPKTEDTTSSKPSTDKKGPRHATAKGENDKLCRIHYRWGVNGTYCAAPWKCPMKDIYKSPQ